MKIIGLTGGIGSGKTTVANTFVTLGIPVYVADTEAKRLMDTSKVIKRQLIALLGEEAYSKDTLNRDFIASKIFNNKTYLSKMNAIVHPKVASHFKRWLKKQNSPYIIKEAAIIFEQNMQSQYDYIITVIATKEDKIERILKRDKTSKEKILMIMNNQMSDEEKTAKSDYTIINNTLEDTKNQVFKIHKKILKHIAKP